VVRHVYVHVPFCASICPFCAFDVRVNRDTEIDRYLERLDTEAAGVADRLEVVPDTVYLGGGTPSQLDDRQLERLVGILSDRFAWAPGDPAVEATIELHPDDVRSHGVTLGRARRLVGLGFNRLSVGVQSTDDAILARLGRTHDASAALAAVEDCVAAVAAAAAAGRAGTAAGGTVSADLMVAVAGQDWERDLTTVAATGVDHVSTYSLTVEPGTPFARRGVRVDEEDELRALDAATEVLGAAGIDRYEVSNHARPGSECRHNRAYWSNSCWVGLGPSAGGHEPALATPGFHDAPDGSRPALTDRVANARGTAWFDGAAPERSPCDSDTWWADAVACGLRMVDGVDLDGLAERAGSAMPPLLADGVERLTGRGWLAADGPRISATAAGTRVLDRVMAEIWA